jgi:hypothetical protein
LAYLHANGQEDWYSNSLKSTIKKLTDTDTTNCALIKQYSVFFYRTWETNPKDWIPAYYHVYSLLRYAEEGNCTDKEEQLRLAVQFLKKSCSGFMHKNEMRILQAKTNLLQYQFFNDTLALKQSGLLLTSSLKREKENHRARVVMAQYQLIINNRSIIGKRKALSLVESVINQPERDIVDQSLQPAWGRKEAEKIQQEINLSLKENKGQSEKK